MSTDRDLLKMFIDERNRLIEKLDRKEIGKEEFILENMRIIDTYSMKPYPEIENSEQGLYNYHYYNILAKHHNNKAVACRNDRRGRKRRKLEFGRRDNYYREKDKVIMELLKITEDENIDAYFIDIDSKRLRNGLMEIVLKDVDKAILHSLDEDIYRYLKRRGVFREGMKRSIIHDYVNKPY